MCGWHLKQSCTTYFKYFLLDFAGCIRTKHSVAALKDRLHTFAAKRHNMEVMR